MYNAFISYSHEADDKMAPALQHGIMRYAIPWYKRSKLNIFRDESSLSISPHLWANIQESLSKSEYFIYLASQNSAKSQWVQKELEYWIKNKPINKLIIVLTDGVAEWDKHKNSFKQSEHSSIPILLDLQFNEEPFYIDLRALKAQSDLSLKNSIFNKEILKITAELYGISQKEMAGEEVKTQSKVKRITTTVIASLLIAFLTTFYFFKESKSNLKKAVYNEKVADSARTNVSELLQVALQGRGDQYQGKPIDTIISTLQFERIRPLEELITPNAIRERVGNSDNYDYLIWIDVPSFRTDSIIQVSYQWPSEGYRFARGDNIITKEAATGYAFGYRGINAIKDYINVTIFLKGNKRIRKQFKIREYLNIIYDEPNFRRIEYK